MLAGLLLMAFALLVSSRDLAPNLATTVTAIAGFLILMYGVHLAWLVLRTRARRAVQLTDSRQAGAEASCINRSTMSSSTSAKKMPTTSSISLNPSAQKSSG